MAPATLRLRPSTFLLTGPTSIICQSIFEKIDNHRSKQACRDFRCTEDESSFEKFSLAFPAPFGSDVDLFLSHRQQDNQCADGGGGCNPGNCLFSKRSSELSRKIQFILQTTQITCDTLTRMGNLCRQLTG